MPHGTQFALEAPLAQFPAVGKAPTIGEDRKIDGDQVNVIEVIEQGSGAIARLELNGAA